MRHIKVLLAAHFGHPRHSALKFKRIIAIGINLGGVAFNRTDQFGFMFIHRIDQGAKTLCPVPARVRQFRNEVDDNGMEMGCQCNVVARPKRARAQFFKAELGNTGPDGRDFDLAAFNSQAIGVTRAPSVRVVNIASILGRASSCDIG